MNPLLLAEVRRNLRDVVDRLIATGKVLLWLLVSSTRRNPAAVFDEYDDYWDRSWESRDIFRGDLPFLCDGVPCALSPFEAKRGGIVNLLAEITEEHGFRSVLEVGSGAGLNLMFLAPRFPGTQFFGLEPTDSGGGSRSFVQRPPPEFEQPTGSVRWRTSR